MIVLFTDFGWKGPYVGQIKSVLSQQAPNFPIIDLMHDAPVFAIQTSAYLLASLVEHLPSGCIVLGVVDPGVGDIKRKPCILKADGRYYVGPDNGLFNIIARRAKKAEWWEIKWRPKQLSTSFHGRDLFAPVAAQLATEQFPDAKKISGPHHFTDDWPGDFYQVIYFDHYGNAMTGLRAEQLDKKTKIRIKQHILPYAETFSAVKLGEAFWYKNSNGLVELSVNNGNAQQQLNLVVGDELELV